MRVLQTGRAKHMIRTRLTPGGKAGGEYNSGSSNMRASVRIFAGLAIGIVVCFVSAVIVAVTMALAQTYFSERRVGEFLRREYNYGFIHMSGADIVLVGASISLGILATAIWLYATRWTRADKAAFSGAGIITGAEPRQPLKSSSEPSEPPPTS